MYIFKIFILVIILSIVSISNAQIDFESGYYIDNSDNKIEGFIQNID